SPPAPVLSAAAPLSSLVPARATPAVSPLSLHDALPIFRKWAREVTALLLTEPMEPVHDPTARSDERLEDLGGGLHVLGHPCHRQTLGNTLDQFRVTDPLQRAGTDRLSRRIHVRHERGPPHLHRVHAGGLSG